MANDFTSNVSRKLMRTFLKSFESNRVITKTVNTQLLSGKFNPASGSTVDFKRPHDYRTFRTAGGDISAVTKDSITSGKATGTVQNYFTAATEWTNVQEALETDQLDEILAPMAQRIVTDLEVDFADFMMKNSSQAQGTVGTAATTWAHVAEAGALAASMGWPMDSPWYYVFNPFTQVALADAQKGLAGNDTLIQTAWQRAQISRPMAGLQALTGVTLSSYTTDAEADRAAAIGSAPTQTYASVKDTMTQTIAITGFGAGTATVKAGDVIEIVGTEVLNKATRKPARDASGAAIPFRAVVTADSAMTGGAGNIVISGPFINETNGQYNTAQLAGGGPLVGSEVVNILGAADTAFAPNLFYHEQAFGLGTVKIPKLFSTDTTATTKDGFSFRVSKYADGDTNEQKIRFDLLPAYAVLNPFYAGHGWGHA